MAKKLVIVESPAKAKTIEKFLGRDFEVRASMGHIIDLPKKGLGVNTRKDFTPQYEVIENKDKLIDELRAASSRASEVYLAPDPDREGEFIAWSLKETLGLKNPRRAVFNEITKSAVQQAIKKPREINEDLFNAQQARRVLDRLVGYKISPLLWRRIQSGTSAGRVQSVALRVICDREAEIRAFVPEEYWTISAVLGQKGATERFEAMLTTRLQDMALMNSDEAVTEESEGTADQEKASEANAKANGQEGKKVANGKGRIKIATQAEAEAILADLKDATYTVLKIEKKEQRRQPYLPYTTSTLQQDASGRLYFKPKKTMSVAQQLYEGIELGERGHQGLITYMRTDSTRISEEAQQQVKNYIATELGQPYVGPGRMGKAKATTQDAHEAIRPTDVTLTPQVVKPYLLPDQFKLYNLIWRRFVASFMAPAVFDTVRVDIVAAQYVFRANGSHLKFPGFYAIWPHEDDERHLPQLSTDEVLDLHELKPEQHFTQPPPRFTEASLIKDLEEEGIGRPSTYVTIISTIQDRGYVDQEQRRFVATWLGETVNEVMNKHFPDIVDTSFTAAMERKLDEVEEGRQSWKDFLRSFYGDFKEVMKKAEAEMDRVQKPIEEMDEFCPDCNRPLVIRTGRFGRFISCSGFPECSYRRSFVNKTGALCPMCGGDLVERKTRQKKRLFYGCNNYPACNFAMWERPIPDPCPTCQGLMVVVRPGQDPVCYQEVIVPSRSKDEKPRQNGTEKRQTTTRARAAKGPDEVQNTEEAAFSEPIATRTRTTSTKRGQSTDKTAHSKSITTRTRATATKRAQSTDDAGPSKPSATRTRATSTKQVQARKAVPARQTTAAKKALSTKKSATTAKKTTGALARKAGPRAQGGEE